MSASNEPLRAMDPPMTDFEENDVDEDDDTVVGTCLHCNRPPPPRSYRSAAGTLSAGCIPCPASDPNAVSTISSSQTDVVRVQVSCDDCRSFICDGCHWCHEFQANHEIRVCDRCDAFYCRACDEMDQCEDCSEVVCNTCSTLMSCKFCGCGLCEDCATACGRCGIVLCTRDAKFAVECDNCKMPYCLVCLASGTKDPCVRCGHRPSKRVEQLVHLRLKSIYKAFKQSGASVSGGPGPPVIGNGVCSHTGSGSAIVRNGAGRDISSMGGKYSSALRSLTKNESLGVRNSDASTNFDQSMANEVAAVLQTASTTVATDWGDDHRRVRGKRISSHPSFSHDNQHLHGNFRNDQSQMICSNSSSERFLRKTQAEIEAAVAVAEAEAEAAAAALLAELDEEKAANFSKKSKKKKKKKDKKREIVIDSDQDSPTRVVNIDNKARISLVQNDLLLKKEKNFKTASITHHSLDDESSVEEEMILEQLVGMGKTSRPSKKDKKEEGKEKTLPTVAPPTTILDQLPKVIEPSRFENNLAALLSDNDEKGLEDFLDNLRGIPGLAALRKTAKKALKRIREENKVPDIEKQTNETISSLKAIALENDTKVADTKSPLPTPASVATEPPSSSPIPLSSAGVQHEPLLKVVARTQPSAGTLSVRGGGITSLASNTTSARAECIMHMSPSVVGWVIGKGGQRIRDMMEESGAKIWIDQESMGAKDARVVYISGKRSAVDAAVRMVKDLVSKAPVSSSASTAQMTLISPLVVANQTTPLSSKSSSPIVAPAQTSSILEAVRVLPSFDAATTSESPASISASAIDPNTSAVTTLPAQRWSSLTPPVNIGSVATSQMTQQPYAGLTMPSSANTLNSSIDQSVRTSLMDGNQSGSIFSEFSFDPQLLATIFRYNELTAKNIQAESGANLYYNQSKEPGKILISGKIEQVNKAEQLIRRMLSYSNNTLHQEVPKASTVENIAIGCGVFSNFSSNNGDFGKLTDPPIMPPKHIRHFHQQKSADSLRHQHQKPRQTTAPAVEQANFAPMYSQYQQGEYGFSRDSTSSNTTSNILLSQHAIHPQRSNISSSFNESNVVNHPQEWVQSTQAPAPTLYSSMAPFIYGRDQYIQNLCAPLSKSSSHNGYSTISDQNTHLLHNVEPSSQAIFLPPLSLNDGIENFFNKELSIPEKNDWGLKPKNNIMGESWHAAKNTSAASVSHQRSFPSQRSSPLDTTTNPTSLLLPIHSDGIPASQTTEKVINDDSQFVDRMFDCLVETGGSGDGLLKPMNSMTLTGSQQGAWSSTLPSWGGLGSSIDTSFLNSSTHSALGLNSLNFGGHSHESDER